MKQMIIVFLACGAIAYRAEGMQPSKPKWLIDREAREAAAAQAAAEATMRIEQRSAELRGQAPMALEKPEGKAIAAVMDQKLQAIRNRIANGDLRIQDITNLTSYIEEQASEGYISEVDLILKNRLFLDFFNREDVNRELIDRAQAALDSPHDEARKRMLIAFKRLLTALRKASEATEIPLTNQKILTKLRFSIDKTPGLVSLQAEELEQ